MQVVKAKRKGREDEEENVHSYWLASRKIEYTGIFKAKGYLARCGELPLKEAIGLSQDGLLNNERI
jgi:hypothetical protein